jgi:hypothetical protein
MSLNKYKHTVNELDGVRCSIIDDNATESRVNFLKELLLLNKFEIKFVKNPPKTGQTVESFTVGVTDITFTPILAVFNKKLITKEKKSVTPNYWNQKFENADIPYYLV